MPGSFLDVEDTTMKNIAKIPTSWSLHLVEETVSVEISKIHGMLGKC